MDRQKVKSSQIASVGWTGDTMEVEFHQGGVFRYPGVPRHVYEGMMKSPSVGSYFHTHVKTAKRADGKPLYPHTKV